MKGYLAVWLSAFFMLISTTVSHSAEKVTCWFPPDWKEKAPQAKAITDALAKNSGYAVQPRISSSYPEILAAFSTSDFNLVYVGSFVQAVIKARDLGTPLVQNINGKEFYSGILVYPQQENPEAILQSHPEAISFAVGASSGESSAKAATAGKAAIATPSHAAACGAIKAGKAKAAAVKNWWWETNKQNYPELAAYEIPGISLAKNPDNVLTASRSMPAEMTVKIKEAAIASAAEFGAPQMAPFDLTALDFSLELMKKGQIDPLTYTW